MSKKLILFGDSITAGFYKGCITKKLTERLENYFPEWTVQNAGIPGDTTKGAVARCEQHVTRYQPDFVTVFFGANDLSSDHWVPLDDYVANLEHLIVTIGPEKVLLLGPPYSDQRIRKADRPVERIQQYSIEAEKIAQRYQIPFIPVFEKMTARTEADCLALLQSDGLHFSNVGYDWLAAEMAEGLKQVQQAQTSR